MRLLAALSVVLATAGFGGSGPLRDSSTPSQYTDGAGWSIAYPSDLQLEHSSASIPMWGVHEVTISTFAAGPSARAAETAGGAYAGVWPPADQSGTFPPDGAALQITQSGGAFVQIGDTPESRLPIRLAYLEPSTTTTTPVRPLVGNIEANGWNYSVSAWFGPAAAPAVRHELDAVLQSLTFPRLAPGMVVGYGFAVLKPATAYPLGSATREIAAGVSLYLVHAPGGWYALSWRGLWGSALSYKNACRMHVGTAPLRFTCPRLHATWDRIGRVIRGPGTPGLNDALDMMIAKVGQDGHVLLRQSLMWHAGWADSLRYWPNWQPAR